MEETNIEIKEGDEIKVVNPFLFSTPGMTDESNALVKVVINNADIESISSKGAVGSECFDGFVLLTKEEAEKVLKEISGYRLMDNYADVFDPANKNNDESLFEIQFKEGNDGYASNFFYVFLAQPITAEEVTAITGIPEVARIVEGYNIPTPDIIKAYEEGDLRKDASIGMLTAHGVKYPYIKKYCHTHAVSGITNDNWPVYRYAETLLFIAEALNEQGKTDEALTYLNQVRKRAGLNDCEVTDQALLREAILDERRVELAFENKRWLDLIHSGKVESVMKAYGNRVKTNPQDYYFPEGYGVAPQSYTDIRVLFPLPAAEAALTTYF